MFLKIIKMGASWILKPLSLSLWLGRDKKSWNWNWTPCETGFGKDQDCHGLTVVESHGRKGSHGPVHGNPDKLCVCPSFLSLLPSYRCRWSQRSNLKRKWREKRVCTTMHPPNLSALLNWKSLTDSDRPKWQSWGRPNPALNAIFPHQPNLGSNVKEQFATIEALPRLRVNKLPKFFLSLARVATLSTTVWVDAREYTQRV